MHEMHRPTVGIKPTSSAKTRLEEADSMALMVSTAMVNWSKEERRRFAAGLTFCPECGSLERGSCWCKVYGSEDEE